MAYLLTSRRENMYRVYTHIKDYVEAQRGRQIWQECRSKQTFGGVITINNVESTVQVQNICVSYYILVWQ